MHWSSRRHGQLPTVVSLLGQRTFNDYGTILPQDLVGGIKIIWLNLNAVMFESMDRFPNVIFLLLTSNHVNQLSGIVLPMVLSETIFHLGNR